MFQYRSKSMWNNSVVFHLIVSAILWMPIAFFGLWITIESGDIQAYFLIPSLLLIWALVLYRRAYTKIRFPAVEVSSEHLILNMPMYNRTVYNLAEIQGAKFVCHSLYFRHLGWPVISTFGSMPKDKQVELLLALKGGQ